MTFSGLAVANLRHRSFRMALTASSIAICIAVTTVVLAVSRRMNTLSDAGEQNDIRVDNLDPQQEIPFSYLKQVESLGANVIAWFYSLPVDDRHHRFVIIGVNDDPEHGKGYVGLVSPTWFSVSQEDARKWRAERQALLVGSATMKHMGWKPGQLVTLTSRTEKRTVTLAFKVIGAATGLQTTNCIAHYEYVDEVVKSHTLHTFVVRAPLEQHAALIQTLDEQTENSAVPTRATPLVVWKESIVNAMSTVPRLIVRLGALIFLLTAFITASTLAVSLRERATELTALRTLGFSRLRIVQIIMIESIALCLLGGLVGAAVPFLLYHREGLELDRWVLRSVTIDPQTFLLGLLSTVVLGVVVAVVPLAQTLRRLSARQLTG